MVARFCLLIVKQAISKDDKPFPVLESMVHRSLGSLSLKAVSFGALSSLRSQHGHPKQSDPSGVFD